MKIRSGAEKREKWKDKGDKGKGRTKIQLPRISEAGPGFESTTATTLPHTNEDENDNDHMGRAQASAARSPGEEAAIDKNREEALSSARTHGKRSSVATPAPRTAIFPRNVFAYHFLMDSIASNAREDSSREKTDHEEGVVRDGFTANTGTAISAATTPPATATSIVTGTVASTALTTPYTITTTPAPTAATTAAPTATITATHSSTAASTATTTSAPPASATSTTDAMSETTTDLAPPEVLRRDATTHDVVCHRQKEALVIGINESFPPIDRKETDSSVAFGSKFPFADILHSTPLQHQQCDSPIAPVRNDAPRSNDNGIN